MIGASIFRIVPQGRSESAKASLAAIVSSGLRSHITDEYITRDGRRVWIKWSVLFIDKGKSAICLGRDVTQEKANQARLIHPAENDAITGLPNRRSCLAALERSLARARSSGSAVAVLFIDLDRFKEVNDAFGHGGGDTVLVAIGERLKQLAGEGRFPSRISGDEFIFILCGCDERDAAAFAALVLDELRKPIKVCGVELTAGASIGIAGTGDGNIPADELVNRADNAMYAAKAAGRFAVRIFHAEVAEAHNRRLKLRKDMERSIHAGHFFLQYQPVYSLKGQPHIVSAEALVRWNHPEFGLLSPGEFLPIAEESAVMLTLGEWVIDEACRQIAEWRDAGRTIRISVAEGVETSEQCDLLRSAGCDSIQGYFAGRPMPAGELFRLYEDGALCARHCANAA